MSFLCVFFFASLLLYKENFEENVLLFSFPCFFFLLRTLWPVDYKNKYPVRFIFFSMFIAAPTLKRGGYRAKKIFLWYSQVATTTHRETPQSVSASFSKCVFIVPLCQCQGKRLYAPWWPKYIKIPFIPVSNPSIPTINPHFNEKKKRK